MSNSLAFGIRGSALIDTPEPPTRLVNMNLLGQALLEYTGSAGQDALRLQLQSAGDRSRIRTGCSQGLQRDDLFTVVFEQVFTDTARYADVVLPATTFLEHYDIAKGYGPITLQLVRPVIQPEGEARPNAEVFSELAERLGIGTAEERRGNAVADYRKDSRMASARNCSSMGWRRLPTAASRSSSSTSFR